MSADENASLESLLDRDEAIVRIEDALRAAWGKYKTTGDWYDAVGISTMAELAYLAIITPRSNPRLHPGDAR